MTEPVFRGEPLLDILAFVERALAAGDSCGFFVLDPDLGRGRYAGELVEHAGERYVHRPLRVWVDLAERLGLRLRTPRPEAGLIRIGLERLEAGEAMPRRRPAGDRAGRAGAAPAPTERYGRDSEYARISKLEDPGFVLDLAEALARTRLGARPRVLDLGVNTGDELAVIRRAFPDVELVGVDHSASALAVARARYPQFQLLEADLGQLAGLGLGRFDLVISLSTLQSPGIDDRELLRRIVQHHLAPGGAVILGLPNSRYIDGELVYGARIPNFRQPELGVLVKDIAFYRKYLQQHGRQVFVTGKHYVLITGAMPGGGDADDDANAADRAGYADRR
ncbi:MAG TPA: class I SAM-dependent methyltransferase [Kofleriaceae bacterium]|nr:class I SAM-dependent methyltransferase [Kofleriaceae bacterium]